MGGGQYRTASRNSTPAFGGGRRKEFSMWKSRPLRCPARAANFPETGGLVTGVGALARISTGVGSHVEKRRFPCKSAFSERLTEIAGYPVPGAPGALDSPFRCPE